jgi:hypothetical protein
MLEVDGIYTIYFQHQKHHPHGPVKLAALVEWKLRRVGNRVIHNAANAIASSARATSRAASRNGAAPYSATCQSGSVAKRTGHGGRDWACHNPRERPRSGYVQADECWQCLSPLMESVLTDLESLKPGRTNIKTVRSPPDQEEGDKHNQANQCHRTRRISKILTRRNVAHTPGT